MKHKEGLSHNHKDAWDVANNRKHKERENLARCYIDMVEMFKFITAYSTDKTIVEAARLFLSKVFPDEDINQVAMRRIPDSLAIGVWLLPIDMTKRVECEHAGISTDKQYLVKVYGGWFVGSFSRQWYGLNFDNWGTSGLQLDSPGITECYELIGG